MEKTRKGLVESLVIELPKVFGVSSVMNRFGQLFFAAEQRKIEEMAFGCSIIRGMYLGNGVLLCPS